MAGQKEFAKRFDEKQDDFVFLREKLDLELLEINRFLDSQINLLQSKVTNLQLLLERGGKKKALAEVERQIADFEKKSKVLESKLNLYYVSFGETESEFYSVKNFAESLASASDAVALISSLEKVEKTYGIFSNLRLKSIFLNFVETVELLVNRVKNLEKIISLLQGSTAYSISYKKPKESIDTASSIDNNSRIEKVLRETKAKK